MVDYKSLDELISNSTTAINSLNLQKGEKRFLSRFKSEMLDYVKDPAAEDEVKEFYEKICDEGYASYKEMFNDARCLLVHTSHYAHLRDNSLKLIKEVDALIDKYKQQKPANDKLLAQHLHFRESLGMV
ncbi:unnamed protein product [marine sediment metagenome]|uniref:Uncharacterized protein n=1 Tax=marine sediment metagenome TaxID=412755 RepID=X0VTE1_9ZZZZ